MSKKAEKEFKQTGGIFTQFVGLLTGPIVWLVQFQINYTIVAWECAHDRQRILIHVVTIVALLLVAIGALIAWRNWQRAGVKWPNGDDPTISRTRFLSVLGLLTGAGFFLIILVQGVASFILQPCQP